MAASKHKTRAFFYSYFKRMWGLPVLDAELVWILQKSGRRWSTVLWYGKCTYSERNDIDTEQLIFVSLKLKGKKRKKKEIKKISLHPELIAVHLNGTGAQYHWVMSTSDAETPKKLTCLLVSTIKPRTTQRARVYTRDSLLVNFLVL